MAQNGVLKPSLTLQMAAGYSAYIPKLYATQTDNESIDVSVKLMDKTVPYIVPEGYQVNLRAKKPDGTVVFNALAKNGGFYVLKLGGQLTTAVGVVDAAVEVVKGSFVLNSAHFEIEVKPRTVNDGDIASEDDLTALNEYVTRSETAAESAETAADRAETAADQADQAVQSIGTATEDVKKAADSAALSASSAAQSAMEAGQSKTDAGKSAENAAASATAAAQSAAAASQSEKAAGQAAGSASQSALAASNSAQTASDKAGETKTSAQDASDAAQAASSAQTAAESAKTAAETAKGQAETQAGNAAQSAQEASASASAAAESAAQAAASAEQADLAIKTAIKLTKTGELVSITDSIEYPFVGLTVYGKSTQDGTPSPENPVPIVSAGEGGSVEIAVTGKNLLNLMDYTSDTIQISNQVITLNGASGRFNNIPLQNPIILGPGQYTFCQHSSLDKDSVQLQFWLIDDFGFEINTHWYGGGEGEEFLGYNTFNLTDAKTFTIFRVDTVAGDYDGDQIKLMLNFGSETLPWQPYTGQPLLLPTPNGLPGVPVDSGGNYTDSSGQQWVCDEVDLARGVYVQRIHLFNAKDVTWLNDWDPVFPDETENSVVFNLVGAPYVKKHHVGFCNVFKNGNIASNINTFNTARGGGGLGVRVSKTIASNLEEWNEYINTYDVIFALAYKPENYTETPIPEETLQAYRALHTYHPNTNVFGTDNVGLKAQYVADTELFVNNLLADIASLHAVQDAGLGL